MYHITGSLTCMYRCHHAAKTSGEGWLPQGIRRAVLDAWRLTSVGHSERARQRVKKAVRVYGSKARMIAVEHTERSSFWTIGLGFVCVEHGRPTGCLIQGRRQPWFDRKGASFSKKHPVRSAENSPAEKSQINFLHPFFCKSICCTTFAENFLRKTPGLISSLNTYMYSTKVIHYNYE